MEFMNKIVNYKTKFVQKRQVRKERLITLKVNYHKGLVLEYQKKLDDYKAHEETLIQGYHDESLKPIQIRLSGITKND